MALDVLLDRSQENQDVPEHQPSLTSSIGALWPPQKASFSRIKGFYTECVLDNSVAVSCLLDELRDWAEEFNIPGDEVTRVVFRGIIRKNILLQNKEELKLYLEAIIDLEGSQTCFADTCLVYLAINHQSRKSSPSDLEVCTNNVALAKSAEKKTLEKSIYQSEQLGYSISILSLPKEAERRAETIDQMTALYARFGWNREEVEEIISNPDTIIGVASYGGKIVSAGIVELAKIPVGNSYLRIAEITEAATMSEHGGNGIYRAVSSHLLRELQARSRNNQILGGELDLVFGECNGNAPGVLKTAVAQGRAFSVDTGVELGFPETGILRQQVPISGAPRTTPYNDLFPTYLTKEKLYQLL